MRTCLYSLTIHFLLTEVLRRVVPLGLSMFARTRNYLVDLPGEENPENPELAITGEGRGATLTPELTPDLKSILSSGPM